jgi:hypothetical protein
MRFLRIAALGALWLLAPGLSQAYSGQLDLGIQSSGSAEELTGGYGGVHLLFNVRPSDMASFVSEGGVNGGNGTGALALSIEGGPLSFLGGMLDNLNKFGLQFFTNPDGTTSLAWDGSRVYLDLGNSGTSGGGMDQAGFALLSSSDGHYVATKSGLNTTSNGTKQSAWDTVIWGAGGAGNNPLKPVGPMGPDMASVMPSLPFSTSISAIVTIGGYMIGLALILLGVHWIRKSVGYATGTSAWLPSGGSLVNGAEQIKLAKAKSYSDTPKEWGRDTKWAWHKGNRSGDWKDFDRLFKKERW